MPAVSNFTPVRLFIIPVIALLLWKGSARVRLFLLSAALLLAFTDWITSDFIKHILPRRRPYQSMLYTYVYIYKQWIFIDPPFFKLVNETLSFPSTHAVSVWALATFLRHFYARLAPAAYCLAIIVCLSRIYVGFHYPTDIVAGGILGALIAVGYYHLLRYLMIKLDRRQKLVWLLFPQKRTP